jgi:glycosyltransferase involved in cell wall biosynthesis
MTAEQARSELHRYVSLVGVHVVAVSVFKGQSWGFTEDIVPFGMDPADYLPYSGQFPCGLRISNFIQSRRQILLWDFHQRAFECIPMMLVGHNPGMLEASPSENWGHLKRMLSSYRFYVHTADPRLEDGYNMATIEAMAAGLPVLGNDHPTSPVQHGVSGFLSDDPKEVQRFARLLLADRGLATDMGRRARKLVSERFSLATFRDAFTRSIETARAKNRQTEPLPIKEIQAGSPPLPEALRPSIVDLAARSRTARTRRRVVPR